MKTSLWKTSTRYQMHECVGEGAHAQVFRAERSVESLGMSQKVAIKILQSENAVEMWRKEFESLSRVKSPYCVQVFAFEQLERGPALILEHVDGLNLRDLVHYGVLSGALCGEILAQIQLGLNDLQSFGLCHGDLSPKNIMVDTSGLVRLLDFGLANSGAPQYTPGFAAPELAQGVTHETDLYSLGAIAGFLERFSDLKDFPAYQQTLAECPSSRQPLPLHSVVGRRRQLAAAVQAAMDKRNSFRELKTKTVRAVRHMQKTLLHVQVFVMACLVTFSASSKTNANGRAAGSLRIRTQNWYAISVDGHALGYSPLDINSLTPGSHKITWRSGEGQGTLAIKISEGRTTLIGESELKSY